MQRISSESHLIPPIISGYQQLGSSIPYNSSKYAVWAIWVSHTIRTEILFRGTAYEDEN